MSICYIDAFSGLAGDMLTGALADAGADREAISTAIHSLAAGATITWERVKRRGMAAEKFRVEVEETNKHRHLPHILEMIETAAIPAPVKSTASKVFQVLAEAEAVAHGVSLEKVHFHEVGAADSIADIIGSCLGFHLLGVTEIYCSAINTGSGTVKTEHGILPVPAPATAALLVSKPIYARGPATELTTPTGAAIVAALASGFGSMPAMTVQSIGYGAGDKDFPEHANLVRVMLGNRSGARETTTVTVIEVNLDDATPQIIAHAAERLLEAGALDVTLIPVYMKKGRPGVTVQVIANPTDRDALSKLIFEETPALGVRFYDAERRVLPRDWVTVETKYGPVRVKTSPEGFTPEYEDCKAVAKAAGVSLKQVLTEATAAHRNKP